MKASDYIVSFLHSKGVDVVFGYIGGMITHLVDSLDKNSDVRYIQTYHEQTAAIAAEGYAIESGKFGVAIATSGPGATNMMTGIADAYFGSIPVLYITGQVNSYEYKYDKPIRQQGFQETDVVSIVKPITKYAVMVDDAKNIRYELEKAIHIATTGRKGPVLIDLPMNISRAEINPDELLPYIADSITKKQYDVKKTLDAFVKAKNPMVLLGGGCMGYGKQIEAFVRKHSLPVVTSLMGRGVIDETYDNYIGMVGSYGNRCANMAFEKVDMLLALGSRLDTRQTGAKIDSFMPEGTIVHVDIDENELKSHRLENRIQINTDVLEFLKTIEDCTIEKNKEWLLWLQELKAKYNQKNEVQNFVDNKAPYLFMEALNDITENGDVITTDVGQNQMWAAQSIKLKQGQKFITSGGLAPMGFSLPIAIGVAFANPSKKIYCLNGDGGFHMAIQSMLMISQYNLNIKVIVLNNASLGMITQFQHLYFDDRMAGTTAKGGYLIPDMPAIAKAYGFSYQILTPDKLYKLKEVLKADKPVLVDYHIEGLTTVSPKLEYNKPIYRPTPEV